MLQNCTTCTIADFFNRRDQEMIKELALVVVLLTLFADARPQMRRDYEVWNDSEVSKRCS